MSAALPLVRPFARVWGRRLPDLLLEVRDPVGRGLMRAVAALAPPSSAEGGARVLPAGSAEARARPRCVTLSPAWGRDHLVLDALRRENAGFLAPWEATLPPGSDEALPDVWQYARSTDRDQRGGRALVMAVRVDGAVAGQFTVSNVVRGAMSQGMLGYWLAESWAGRGLGSLCAALVVDLVIGELGLHRLEVAVRPQNAPSLGVCRRLGLHREGIRPRFMHIAGAWADHVVFSVDAESLPEGGVLARLEGSGG
ncbi:MAG: GNAT family protein [Schaalia hyovaginalis]|uniref:GNAT family N-acetyltransferase n=1 Tax=Schaalia hyovaginalis TaxID=29316 RepID=UPI0023F83085|nr:GNAT family protein [Schaalia hyovaginalis]MCI7671892.1 GNAT family N-acetyltransferase [Schaalia hyovaginalis]MDY5505980.1 GNAT family protein [Schaalia hyovaginalis]